MKQKLVDLKEKIIKRLEQDDRITASDISISVSDNGIAIGGLVPSYFQKITAARIAWNVPGVKNVKNNLKVTIPKEIKEYSDSSIKTNIESLLKWIQSIRGSQIEVQVSGGQVTITGEVDREWKKRRVEQLISDLGGITDIVNKLTVVTTPTVRENKPISEEQVTAQEDNIVADNIIAALDEDPSLDADQISIDVDSGEVTLSGTVKNFQQYETARDAALFRVGVKRVINNLDIIDNYNPKE